MLANPTTANLLQYGNDEQLRRLDRTRPQEPEARLLQLPLVPRSLQDTGVSRQLLLKLVLKFLYVPALETASEISNGIKLPRGIVESLLKTLKKQQLVEVAGMVDNNPFILRYVLSNKGKERAIEALGESGYIGPAPVPLTAYQA